MPRRTILFAAGGSGGHLFPAIAVAEELRRRDPDAHLGIVASEKEVDRSILASYPFERHHLAAVSPSLGLKHPWRVLRENWLAWRVARNLVRTHHPAVVVGCGGFASVPLVCAAVWSRVPVVLLEQNLIPGSANVWLSRWASRICLSFEESIPWLPKAVQSRQTEIVAVTGNPIRQAIHSPAESISRRSDQLLILGGSQGARHLNTAVAEWLESRPSQLRGWDIVHQTGSADLPAIAARYAALNGELSAKAVDFIAQPAGHYQKATLVISRAGATSLAELACLGTPAILVPLPSAARDHQTANARWFCERGAARMVSQGSTPTETAGALHEVVLSLLQRPACLQEMSESMRQVGRADAAAAVADIVLKAAQSTAPQ